MRDVGAGRPGDPDTIRRDEVSREKHGASGASGDEAMSEMESAGVVAAEHVGEQVERSGEMRQHLTTAVLHNWGVFSVHLPTQSDCSSRFWTRR
jgi:hypothetical protein